MCQLCVLTWRYLCVSGLPSTSSILCAHTHTRAQDYDIGAAIFIFRAMYETASFVMATDWIQACMLPFRGAETWRRRPATEIKRPRRRKLTVAPVVVGMEGEGMQLFCKRQAWSAALYVEHFCCVYVCICFFRNMFTLVSPSPPPSLQRKHRSMTAPYGLKISCPVAHPFCTCYEVMWYFSIQPFLFYAVFCFVFVSLIV